MSYRVVALLDENDLEGWKFLTLMLGARQSVAKKLRESDVPGTGMLTARALLNDPFMSRM